MPDSLEIDLDPSEWDFRPIPKEELEIAVIYEYCREIPEVSKQISDWLDGKYEERDYDDVEGRGVFVSHLKVREALIDGLGCYPPLPDEAIIPQSLAGHRVLSICPFLIEWPKTYLALRKNPLFGKVLKSRQPPPEGLYPMGMLRSNNRLPCKLSGKEGLTVRGFETDWDLPTYGFDIDMTFTPTEIEAEFKAWLKKEHARLKQLRPKAEQSGPGRKPGKRLPDASLSALSALRLTKRGQTGKKRDHEWVEEALSSYVKLTTNPSNPFPNDTLPRLGEKGFREAVGRAEELIEEFQKYRVWDEKLGRTVEKKGGVSPP